MFSTETLKNFNLPLVTGALSIRKYVSYVINISTSINTESSWIPSLFKNIKNQLESKRLFYLFVGHGFLLWNTTRRQVVHVDHVAAADRNELNSQSQVSGSVLHDCKLFGRHLHDHYILVRVPRHAIQQTNGPRRGLAEVAAVLRHCHLRARRNRRGKWFPDEILIFTTKIYTSSVSTALNC